MKLLYFTTACQAENYERIQQKSRVKASVAAQTFETALLRGMLQQDNLELTLHSFPMIAAFPGSKLLCWGARKEVVAESLKTTWLPTINLYGFKQWSQGLSAKRAVKRWLQKNRNEQDKAVLLYSAYEPIAVQVQKYCRSYGCKCFAIIPDLPRDMYKKLSPNRLFAALQKRYMKNAVKCQDGFDGYIYLTEAMAEVVAPGAPYTVIEGIADTSVMSERPALPDTGKKAIMYAGAISMQYGIGNLIKAVCALQRDDIELWIFGAGSDAEQVEKLAAQQDNIHFFGRRSREEVLAFEQKAALLVNVRDPRDDFTKYSFPSKTMEYMLSGTPMLTTKLLGIPQEYCERLILIDDNAPQTIAEGIERAFQMTQTERSSFGLAAADFVAREKNPVKQANKLCGFISACLNDAE